MLDVKGMSVSSGRVKSGHSNFPSSRRIRREIPSRRAKPYILIVIIIGFFTETDRTIAVIEYINIGIRGALALGYSIYDG
jgi:hypothetical protein